MLWFFHKSGDRSSWFFNYLESLLGLVCVGLYMFQSVFTPCECAVHSPPPGQGKQMPYFASMWMICAAHVGLFIFTALFNLCCYPPDCMSAVWQVTSYNKVTVTHIPSMTTYHYLEARETVTHTRTTRHGDITEDSPWYTIYARHFCVCFCKLLVVFVTSSAAYFSYTLNEKCDKHCDSKTPTFLLSL